MAPKTPCDRVIVMIDLPDGADCWSGGPDPADRDEAVASVRKAVERVVPGIDAVLLRYGGRRLPSNADVLGCVIVEAPAAGVRAIADLAGVRGVVADGKISPGKEPAFFDMHSPKG